MSWQLECEPNETARASKNKNPAPTSRGEVEMCCCKTLVVLLHAFFTEASSFGCALACLELRVALTDDVEGAFALYDLAVFVALLHGQKG